MTFDLLTRMASVFIILFSVGTILCLPLYHWDIRGFMRSSLWTKVIWWIPIFSIFIAILFGGLVASMVMLASIYLAAAHEYTKAPHPRRTWISQLYVLTFVIASAHLLILFSLVEHGQAVRLLILVAFCSVLSDVCAFFFGSFAGKHKLPLWINAHKSWEGVIGQIVGALIGYLIVTTYITPMHDWRIALIIGLASAGGDLFNSIAKRTHNIKDWGNTIPGHGGVLDRFSSLSLAIAAASWYVLQ